jgi:hypothetical protein
VFAGNNPMRFLDPDGRGWLDWVGRHLAAAGKVVAGAGGFVVGWGLCATGVGCVVGGPLIFASCDVAASGTMEFVTDEPHPTVIGQLLGPKAQQWEEAAVYGADLAGIAAKATLPKPPHATTPKKPPGAPVSVFRRLVVGGGKAEGFPKLKPGDVSLNVDAAAEADITESINNATKVESSSFDAVHFEDVPFVTDALAARGVPGAGITMSLKEAARALKPGGTLTIESGALMFKGAKRVAGELIPLYEDLAPQLKQALEDLKFKDIEVKIVGEGESARVIVKATLSD